MMFSLYTNWIDCHNTLWDGIFERMTFFISCWWTSSCEWLYVSVQFLSFVFMGSLDFGARHELLMLIFLNTKMKSFWLIWIIFCGVSLEEAKKRIYACSTTTYQGFQAIMTEEESEKFQGNCIHSIYCSYNSQIKYDTDFSVIVWTGIPGVVFILPDSYIDPQNKEYGGSVN